MPYAARVVCGQPGCRITEPHQHGREEHQRSNVEIRRLYRTARWRALREQKRYENPFCVECQKDGRTELWTDLDHIVPHRGDLVKFWDPNNVAGLCKRHHSAKTRGGQ